MGALCAGRATEALMRGELANGHADQHMGSMQGSPMSCDPQFYHGILSEGVNGGANVSEPTRSDDLYT